MAKENQGVRGLLADHDVERHVTALVGILRGPDWLELWNYLNISLISFEDLGIQTDASDRIVWNVCQAKQVLLITGNRNQQGTDSLEAVLRNDNTVASLPVVTIAKPGRVLFSKVYARKAAVKLAQYLFDVDVHRGAGRLYIP